MKLYSSIIIILISCSLVYGQVSEFPAYHSQTDFLFAAPSGMGTGLYGYMNPAILSYQHGMDIMFGISDPDDDLKNYRQFGFFTAVPHLGFGMIKEKPILCCGNKKEITDYNLALSLGNRRFSSGFAYRWSKDNIANFERDDRIILSTLYRPQPYLSIGLQGTFAGEKREGVAELALRPFGNPLLTLFGDFALQDDEKLDDAHWSGGAVMEALPGFRITGRYFDTEAFTVGVNLSFGRGTFASQSHYDQENEYDYNTYTVQVGSHLDRSFIHQQITRNDHYAKVELLGSMKYQSHLFFDNSRSFLKFLADIQAAKEDTRVRGIVINTSGMQINREMLWEIREKLKDFQSGGKKVVIYIDRGGIDDYHFVSVADYIIIDPLGTITLEGYLMGRTYIKGTLDKLGIGFDEWRYFKYKSAAEAVSREDMSEAEREQSQALIDDFYHLAKTDICQSRGFSEEQFDRLVNEEWVFSASEALEMGLVDTIARWEDDVKDFIEKIEDDKKNFIPLSRLKEDQYPAEKWGENPQIAVIYAVGVCAMDMGIEARRLVKIIESVEKNNDIKAVVLRVDSPGGDGLASDLVAEALQKCKEKKPVIISQGYVAASGGYWLSMYGDQIVAAPNTITGSIGVIGGWLYNAGVKESMKMTTDYVKVGEHRDLFFGMRLPLLNWMLPDRNLNEVEQAKIEERIKGFYWEFVEKVAAGRARSPEEIDEIAQGRVWSGYDALENGLIDRIGGLETAIQLAKAKANIDADQDVTIVQYPKKGWFSFDRFGPRIMGVQIDLENNDVLNYLKFRLEQNGQAMPILPLELMEGQGITPMIEDLK